MLYSDINKVKRLRDLREKILEMLAVPVGVEWFIDALGTGTSSLKTNDVEFDTALRAALNGQVTEITTRLVALDVEMAP